MMGKRQYLLPVFIILSLCIFFFSKTFVTPLDFISSLFALPRAALYGLVHASSHESTLEKLKNENKKLVEKQSAVHVLAEDNIALRSQFQDTFTPSETLTPAKIVGFKGSISLPTTFILNQGTKSNIKKGMAVIVGRQLVGKVLQVSPFFSEVQLILSKNFSALSLSGDHDSPGIISGQEEFLLFEDVVITDTISKNELVLTHGEQDINGVGIPPGLIIGKITTVNKSESKPFQSAVVETIIDFKKLTTVFIITK